MLKHTHIDTHWLKHTLCKKKKTLLQLTRSASDELTQIHISEHTQNNQCPIRFCKTPYTPTPQSFSYSTKWLNTKQWKVTEAECSDTLTLLFSQNPVTSFHSLLICVWHVLPQKVLCYMHFYCVRCGWNLMQKLWKVELEFTFLK